MSEAVNQSNDATVTPNNDASVNNAPNASQTAAGDGATSSPTEPADARPLSPRARQMQEIIANRQAVQNEELIYGEQLGDAARQASGAANNSDTVAAVDNATSATDNSATPATNSSQPQPVAGNGAESQQTVVVPREALNADGRVAVTVAGQVFHLTQDELNALVADGANARLTSTGEAMQRQRAVQVPQQQTQTAPVQQTQPTAQPRDYSQLLTDAEAQELYSSIAIGNEADGAAAIRRLGSMIASRVAESEPRQAPIDTNALVNEAAVRAQAEIVRQQNLQTIAGEFPDIFSDARIGRLAGEEVQTLATRYRAMGINKSQLDLFREGCQNIRGLFGSGANSSTSVNETTGNASPQPTVIVQPRETGKGGLQTVPQGAGSRTAQATQAAQPTKTPSDVVNSMRKSRGQAVYR